MYLCETELFEVELLIYKNRAIGQMSWEFANGLGTRFQNQVESYQRIKKNGNEYHIV